MYTGPSRSVIGLSRSPSSGDRCPLRGPQRGEGDRRIVLGASVVVRVAALVCEVFSDWSFSGRSPLSGDRGPPGILGGAR